MFVCTGNTIRSPLAQALVAAIASRRRWDLTATSAGTTPGDRPLDPVVTRWLAASPAGSPAGRHAGGGQAPGPTAPEVRRDAAAGLVGHRSRLVGAEDVAGVDLVVAMARAHVRHVVALHPPTWPVTFTLKELARRTADGGRRRPGEPVGTWLARLGDGRRPGDLLGDSSADDLPDPVGAPDRAAVAVLDELARLVWDVLDALGPLPLR